MVAFFRLVQPGICKRCYPQNPTCHSGSAFANKVSYKNTVYVFSPICTTSYYSG